MKPIIHLNGDDATCLMRNIRRAKKALHHAIKLAELVAPHPRNYPGAGDQYEQDRSVYMLHMKALRNFREELLKTQLHLFDVTLNEQEDKS